jgi:hypothetical protein
MAGYIELLNHLQNDDYDAFFKGMSAEAEDAKFVISFLNVTDQDLDDTPTVALSPIQMAVQSKDTRILQYLIDLAKNHSEKIDLGALINKPIYCPETTEINGKTYKPKQNALHLAVKTKNTEIVKLLLSQQSKTPIDINAQDDEDNTPLHLAAAHNDLEMVKVLLAHDKINVDIKNKEKKIPDEATSFSFRSADNQIKKLIDAKKPKSVPADSSSTTVTPASKDVIHGTTSNNNSSTSARAVGHEDSSGNSSSNSSGNLIPKRTPRPFIYDEHIIKTDEQQPTSADSSLTAAHIVSNTVTHREKSHKKVIDTDTRSTSHKDSNNNNKFYGRSRIERNPNNADLINTNIHTKEYINFKKVSENTESKSAWAPLYEYTIGAYINWRNKFTPKQQLALNILVCAIIGALIGLLFFGVGSAFGAAIGAEVGAAMGLSTATAAATTSAAVAGSVTAGAATSLTVTATGVGLYKAYNYCASGELSEDISYIFSCPMRNKN